MGGGGGAVRGHGGVATNPLVGCIVLDASGTFAGCGFHRRHGGPHAEVVALRHAGGKARGGTLYATLEPCTHHGKTPPCTDAIIASGVSRVIYGAADPHPEAAGGAAFLRTHQVHAALLEQVSCQQLIEPFLWRLRTSLPWITAKWAQTIDGRIAARTGSSQWISGERSRRLVHRERGRVEAILTAIGTILADNPRLTARGVRLRCLAERVIIDPRAETPVDAAVLSTIAQAPVHIITHPSADRDRIDALRAAGADVHAGRTRGSRIALGESLIALNAASRWPHMLVEGGPGLLSALFDEDLVRELAVFTAPLLLADSAGVPPVRGESPASIDAARRLVPRHHHIRGADTLVRYGVPERPKSAG